MAALGALALVTLAGALPASAKNDKAPAPPAPPVAARTIDVLNITDFHGRIVADYESAGAAVLSCAVDSFNHAIFTSTGDNIGASTFVSMSQLDQPTIDVLNKMDLDVSAVGNHEFDRGWDWFSDNVLGAAPMDYRPAEFAYIAANVHDEIPELPEYQIQKVRGVNVGFVGAVTEELPSLVSPAGIEGITVGSITDDVNRVAEDLLDGDRSNGEADIVIALIHEGLTSTGDDAMTVGVFGDIVAGLSEDVAAVFGGHTHVAYAGSGAGLTVVQSTKYGEALGRIELSVSPAGKVRVSDAEVIDLVDKYVVVDPKTSKETTVYEPICEGDRKVQDIVDMAVAEAEIVGSVPIGRIGADFNRAVQSDGKENRGGESTIGNLIADAQLWGTELLNTELAFMNPGGIRTDLDYDGDGDPATDLDGVVTFQEAAEVQPFANTLVTMDLTGAQVIDVLEQQVQPATASRPFLKLGVAGLTYQYQPEFDPDGGITKMTITEVKLDSGAPFNENATYRIVVNSFLASGGDNFTAFTGGEEVADSGRIDLDVFIDYVAEHSPLMPDYGQRAIGVDDLNGNMGSVVSGQDVALDLSSLLFSTSGPKATRVVVTFGDEVLGAFDIDPTIVDKYDEVGRAEVRVTIPDLSPYEAGETVTFAVHLDAADGPTVLEWSYLID